MSHGTAVRVYERWTAYRAAGVPAPWYPGVQRGGARVHGVINYPHSAAEEHLMRTMGKTAITGTLALLVLRDTLRLQGHGPLWVCRGD
jgi:hypothetical protein